MGVPLFLCLGSESCTVYFMGLLIIVLKADCPVLRGRHSLPPINGRCIEDFAPTICFVATSYIITWKYRDSLQKSENWEYFLESDNMRMKHNPHATMSQSTLIRLWTLNSKGERMGEAQPAHSYLRSNLDKTEGPLVQPSPASGKDFSSWLCPLTNPCFPQAGVHACTGVGPDTFGV